LISRTECRLTKRFVSKRFVSSGFIVNSRQATCQLPYPFSRFSPPPRFDSFRSSPPPRSILENKGGGRQGECLSALQRLIKSSDERQRVNWQSRQDLADEKVAAVKREEQKSSTRAVCGDACARSRSCASKAVRSPGQARPTREKA
jgi:hypothetical protein